MSALYDIAVNTQPKGEVFKHSGRWCWRRLGLGGIDSYPRGCGLIAIRQHVARLCHVPIASVTLTKKPWPRPAP